GGEASFGENHAFWLHDEVSGVHVNGHLNTCEDLGAFEQRIAKLSVIFPDGRLFVFRDTGAGSDRRTAASGALRFECLEPFARWRCTFKSVMQDVTIARRYATGAALEGFRTPVSFEVEAQMVAPAWINGAFTEGGLGPVKAFMGGERYEQLLRFAGKLQAGGQTFDLAGFGNRTHRVG